MGKNHFIYLWLEKYHLTHLRYVSANLRNLPRSQPLQKHLLTLKHNITRIKTPKTQKLFERETCGEINVFFVVWSVWRGREHNFRNIEARGRYVLLLLICIWVLDGIFLSQSTNVIRICKIFSKLVYVKCAFCYLYVESLRM